MKLKSLLEKTTLKATIAIMSVIAWTNTIAADDGDVSPKKSVAKVDVSLKIPDTIRFAIEVDFDKDSITPEGDIVKQTDACIFFNGGGSYSIIATTNNNGFNLQKSEQQGLPNGVEFKAYWNTKSGREGGVPLTYGEPMTGLAIDEVETRRCVDGQTRGNSNFSIVIPKSSAGKVRVGSYSTTISVVISPD
ncbi:MAG: hypothetical protein D6B28_06755 [Gammaproteobacteria bacterium]|nr:MAG: hypothetical protein D6B28_06755 [Gammaproteobacteria bacterium]